MRFCPLYFSLNNNVSSIDCIINRKKECEIDVHLSNSLAQHLYLLQYPVRPAHMTYDKISHMSARVKPQQKKLEMELSVNTRSPNYARSKGEQIALNVDGRSETSGFYSSNMMDKQIIASAPASETTGRYAVGVMKDGELHLTPLHAVLQMRPSFNYLDKADTKMKVDFSAGGDAEGSQDEEDEEAKPVTMKFARQETEEAKARRMASYDYLQKKREEEAWMPLRFHGIESGMSESQRMQLFASQKDEMSEFQIPPKEYLNMLMPPTDEAQEEKPAMPNNVLSLISLRTMPLPDQVKALLKNAKVIRFSQLMALLPQGTDSVAVMRSLQQVAMLVQGCWVVKSEILYPKDQCSPNSGVSSDHLCRGRDYVMWRFTQSPHVTRKEIASIVKLPAEDVKFILEQVSRIKVHCGWEFLFTFDSDFTSRYPDIVQRQKMLWDAKYQSLCHQLKIPKEHEKKFKDKATTDMNFAGEKPTRRRRHSSRSSGSSRRKRTLSGRSLSDYSDIEMENMENSVEEDDHVTKPCQPVEVAEGDHVTKPCQSMEVAEGDHVRNGPIQNGAVCDNCEPSPEQLLEIHNFVQEKLHSRFVLTVSELKRLYNMRFSEIPPGHVSGENILNDVYEKALDEAGAMKINNQWPPGAVEEQVYVLPLTGDKLDPAREVLLKVFTVQSKINKKSYVKAVEDQLGLTLSENEVRQILKDYCINKGVYWYLKGALPS